MGKYKTTHEQTLTFIKFYVVIDDDDKHTSSQLLLYIIKKVP